METKETKKKPLKDIISSVVNVALVVVLAYLGISLIFSRTLGTDFSFFGFKPVVIMTGSMEPTIETNAVVIVQKTKNYEVGDILMFKENNSYIVHRYYGDSEEGEIITKGDNNGAPDAVYQTEETIYGKVVLILNPLSKIISALNSR